MIALSCEFSTGLEFSDWSDVFRPLNGVLFISEVAFGEDFNVRSGDGFLTGLSLSLATGLLLLLATGLSLLLVRADWNEDDRLRIEGHNPSGARPTSDRLEEFTLSTIESRTGVVDLEDGDKGVEGLDDGDEGTEDLAKGVEGGECRDFGDEGAEFRDEGDDGVDGLLLSADCARWGTDALDVADV